MLEVFIDGRKYDYHAKAKYEDHKITVLKGSVINMHTVDVSKKMSGSVLELRSDRSVVSDSGELLLDITFETPSSAAQFVTGGIRNGFDTWKIEKHTTLGSYLTEQGLR